MTAFTPIATRRRFLQRAGGGIAGALILGRAPAFAQAAPKKLVMAHIVAPPESSAVAFAEMAEAGQQASRRASWRSSSMAAPC